METRLGCSNRPCREETLGVPPLTSVNWVSAPREECQIWLQITEAILQILSVHRGSSSVRRSWTMPLQWRQTGDVIRREAKKERTGMLGWGDGKRIWDFPSMHTSAWQIAGTRASKRGKGLPSWRHFWEFDLNSHSSIETTWSDFPHQSYSFIWRFSSNTHHPSAEVTAGFSPSLYQILRAFMALLKKKYWHLSSTWITTSEWCNCKTK